MSIFEQFGTDDNLESSGVWKVLSTNDDGSKVSFLIASTGQKNKKYTKALAREVKLNKHLINSGGMSDEEDRAISIRVFAKHCLLDWKNVIGADGKVIKHSEGAAIELLTKLPHLYTLLLGISSDIENFKSQKLEADIKN